VRPTFTFDKLALLIATTDVWGPQIRIVLNLSHLSLFLPPTQFPLPEASSVAHEGRWGRAPPCSQIQRDRDAMLLEVGAARRSS
jgi:hypothetical protein